MQQEKMAWVVTMRTLIMSTFTPQRCHAAMLCVPAAWYRYFALFPFSAPFEFPCCFQLLTMDFNPTPEELNRAQHYHQAGPSNLDDPLLLCPGSKWGEDHLRALKVVAVDEVSPIRITPEECLTKARDSQGEALNSKSFVGD
jgi:hypothetical protein